MKWKYCTAQQTLYNLANLILEGPADYKTVQSDRECLDAFLDNKAEKVINFWERTYRFRYRLYHTLFEKSPKMSHLNFFGNFSSEARYLEL